MTLLRDRRAAALLRSRYHAGITVLLCEHKPYLFSPIWCGFRAAAQKL